VQVYPASEGKTEDVIVIVGLMSFIADVLLSGRQVSLNLTESHAKKHQFCMIWRYIAINFYTQILQLQLILLEK